MKSDLPHRQTLMLQQVVNSSTRDRIGNHPKLSTYGLANSGYAEFETKPAAN
jgi:hypothetical protein